jgi:hypothetical protein
MCTALSVFLTVVPGDRDRLSPTDALPADCGDDASESAPFAHLVEVLLGRQGRLRPARGKRQIAKEGFRHWDHLREQGLAPRKPISPRPRRSGQVRDDLVDVGLGELLRFDLVFLPGPGRAVEERAVELRDLDEAAVGDVEFAVEVKGAGVALGAGLGDLAIIDVAGQLGRVLVLLILGP